MLRPSPAHLLLIGLVVFAGAACSRRETLVQSGNREKILHVGNGAEVQFLDPQIAGGSIDHNVLSSLFEGLVTLDETTLQPRPGIADRWESSTDGLVYIFHLRPDARWSNGDPLTAQDFLFSFQRALTPALASEYKDVFYPVKKCGALRQRPANRLRSSWFPGSRPEDTRNHPRTPHRVFPVTPANQCLVSRSSIFSRKIQFALRPKCPLDARLPARKQRPFSAPRMARRTTSQRRKKSSLLGSSPRPAQ